jgi:CheY-like chemotaxis protein
MDEQRTVWTPANIAIAAATVLATLALFAIDALQPRGVLDGVGYPAIVAIASRFGRRPLLGAALVCSVLIVVAHFLVPGGGVSVTGELANRAFGLVSIWIVVEVTQRSATRVEKLRRYQAALARIVREGLVTDHPFENRIRCVTQIAGEAIGADFTGVFRIFEAGKLLVCLDAWRRGSQTHFKLLDIRTGDTPTYDALKRSDYLLAVDDVAALPVFGAKPLVMGSLDMRSLLIAGVTADAELVAQLIFAQVGRTAHWTDQDIAFARAIGHLLTTLFAAERTAQAQARLQQAGKMEALGKLAGGMAHDFNNVLGAIMGFASFLEQDLPPGGEPHRFAARIVGAAKRGKELVERMQALTKPQGDLADALRQSAELARAPLAEASEPAEAVGLRGGERVLVVDDEPDLVDMMVIGLERLGYRAVGVSDPMEALEAFREDPQAFDVVVTDLVMPSLRGTELIRKIKAIRPDIRAILCTAFSDGAALDDARDGAHDASFRKPVGAEAIAECIRAFQTTRITPE